MNKGFDEKQLNKVFKLVNNIMTNEHSDLIFLEVWRFIDRKNIKKKNRKKISKQTVLEQKGLQNVGINVKLNDFINLVIIEMIIRSYPNSYIAKFISENLKFSLGILNFICISKATILTRVKSIRKKVGLKNKKILTTNSLVKMQIEQQKKILIKESGKEKIERINSRIKELQVLLKMHDSNENHIRIFYILLKACKNNPEFKSYIDNRAEKEKG